MFQTPPRQISDGCTIFEEGEASEYAYLVEAGEVEVSVRRSEDGRIVRLATLGPGELIGEMSLVDERPRDTTATAVGPSVVQPFTRDEFEELILNRPDANLRLIRALFERIRLMNIRVERLDADPATPDDEAPSPPEARRTPTAKLIPLTPLAGKSVPAEGLAIRRLPLRIGRGQEGALDLNELCLRDEKPFEVSRNHCSIERDGKRLIVRDRSSHLGTVVNGRRIGGKRGEGAAHLVTGDNEIILGRRTSQWRFRVAVHSPEQASGP